MNVPIGKGGRESSRFYTFSGNHTDKNALDTDRPLKSCSSGPHLILGFLPVIHGPDKGTTKLVLNLVIRSLAYSFRVSQELVVFSGAFRT